MKIYTKTGDKGKTRLLCGCLVSKSDLRIDSYGSVDELNSMMGLAVIEMHNIEPLASLRTQLIKIQNELFNLGSLFACEDVSKIQTLPPINNQNIERLEHEIDQMTEALDPLKNFILPGGGKVAGLLHVARTQCRRAERNSVKLFDIHPEVEQGMVYLNRLSDFLFTAARYANKKQNINDQIWEK